MTAFKAQDANAVAALYTEDCKVMPPGSDVAMGREGTYMLYANYNTVHWYNKIFIMSTNKFCLFQVSSYSSLYLKIII